MEIPKRRYEQWDGGSKYLTIDCPQCDWYREIKGMKLCGWGEAFKYLVKRKSPRKCEVKNREQKSFEPSTKYLDGIIKKHDK